MSSASALANLRASNDLCPPQLKTVCFEQEHEQDHDEDHEQDHKQEQELLIAEAPECSS